MRNHQILAWIPYILNYNNHHHYIHSRTRYQNIIHPHHILTLKTRITISKRAFFTEYFISIMKNTIILPPPPPLQMTMERIIIITVETLILTTTTSMAHHLSFIPQTVIISISLPSLPLVLGVTTTLQIIQTHPTTRILKLQPLLLSQRTDSSSKRLPCRCLENLLLLLPRIRLAALVMVGGLIIPCLNAASSLSPDP